MLRRHRTNAFAQSLHFVTLVTRVRGQWFVHESDCRAILTSFEHTLRVNGLICLAYVLMPDHLHALLLQPMEGEIVSKAIQDFKKYTSRNCRPKHYSGETLWRTRFDDVPIPGPNAARIRVGYMHANPVRKGIVEDEREYLWSSARDYNEIGAGIVTITRLI
jgi:putative transposase